MDDVQPLSRSKIAEIVTTTVREVLPKAKIDRVEVNRKGLTFPSDLGIAIIFQGKGSIRLRGEKLSEVQARILSDLRKSGEERSPHLRFLTAEEAKDLAA
ncbi:MAG: hypothetical protein WDM86_13935 [Rhizomicrobium sp.]